MVCWRQRSHLSQRRLPRRSLSSVSCCLLDLKGVLYFCTLKKQVSAASQHRAQLPMPWGPGQQDYNPGDGVRAGV